jgi:hypothetical protein
MVINAEVMVFWVLRSYIVVGVHNDSEILVGGHNVSEIHVVLMGGHRCFRDCSGWTQCFRDTCYSSGWTPMFQRL